MTVTPTAPPVLHDPAPLTSGPELFLGHPLRRHVTIDHPSGPLEIRPVLPADAPRIAALVAGASQRSRYHRFHGALSSLSPRQLAAIVDVDHHQAETLVALAGGELVGFGQYVPLEPGIADMALMVADDWQGRGIGSELARRLAEAASQSGFEALSVTLLSENTRGIRLTGGLGAVVTFIRHGTTVEARVSLREIPAQAAEEVSAAAGRSRRHAA